MRQIETIEDVAVWVNDDSTLISFTASAMIDGDGSGGNAYNDPDFQADTTYQPALNAELDHYIVLPPQVIRDVPGIVLGCRAVVRNRKTNVTAEAVVGDIGPRSKIGEISVALAQRIGVPSSPTRGGESDHVIDYWIYPGVAAKGYVLQAHA
jgi:hypothetical protein